MTPESDPGFTASVLSWVINAIFALLLFVGRMTFNRAMKKQDDIEDRLRELEKSNVTHADLYRLETKIDDHNRAVTERLDRILERQRA